MLLLVEDCSLTNLRVLDRFYVFMLVTCLATLYGLIGFDVVLSDLQKQTNQEKRNTAT